MRYPEDVFEDPWHWLVIRTSGRQIEEFNPETGKHRSFALASKGAEKIVLLPAHPDVYPNLQPVVLLVPPDARPIVFRSRQTVLVNDPDAPIPEHVRITGIGWQKTINGRNQQTLLALYDDGSMALTDDRQKV